MNQVSNKIIKVESLYVSDVAKYGPYIEEVNDLSEENELNEAVDDLRDNDIVAFVIERIPG